MSRRSTDQQWHGFTERRQTLTPIHEASPSEESTPASPPVSRTLFPSPSASRPRTPRRPLLPSGSPESIDAAFPRVRSSWQYYPERLRVPPYQPPLSLEDLRGRHRTPAPPGAFRPPGSSLSPRQQTEALAPPVTAPLPGPAYDYSSYGDYAYDPTVGLETTTMEQALPEDNNQEEEQAPEGPTHPSGPPPGDPNPPDNPDNPQGGPGGPPPPGPPRPSGPPGPLLFVLVPPQPLGQPMLNQILAMITQALNQPPP